MRAVFDIVYAQAQGKIIHKDHVLAAYREDEIKRRNKRTELGVEENLGTTDEDIFGGFDDFKVFPVVYVEAERQYYGRQVDRVCHNEQVREEREKRQMNTEREERRKKDEACKRKVKEMEAKKSDSEVNTEASEVVEMYQLQETSNWPSCGS